MIRVSYQSKRSGSLILRCAFLLALSNAYVVARIKWLNAK